MLKYEKQHQIFQCKYINPSLAIYKSSIYVIDNAKKSLRLDF